MEWYELLERYGLALAALVIVSLAFVRGDIVPRYIFEDVVKQRDRAVESAEKSLTVAEMAGRMAEGLRVRT